MMTISHDGEDREVAMGVTGSNQGGKCCMWGKAHAVIATTSSKGTRDYIETYSYRGILYSSRE